MTHYTAVKGELETYFKNAQPDETLFDLVEKHLKAKGIKPSAVYRKAQISRQDFSRYVRPSCGSISRTMVFNLAIGLKLDGKETETLLKSAGYGLNIKSKFDFIIMFCIDRKIYDIALINMLLEDFGQRLLKSYYYRENFNGC